NKAELLFMLQSLQIRNYAIIDHLEINFSDDLNIITGETGAGKSIIMGALSLIMGQRADTKVLFEEDKKCFVEAIFDIKNYQLQTFFEEESLDYDNELIIRREISKQGKSRAFINDTPSTLSSLKKLSEYLIDLHQQFDTLDINNQSFQLKILDALAENAELLKSYHKEYLLYKQEQKELEELKDEVQRATAEMDYLNFQLKELDDLSIEKDELPRLEEKVNKLSNAEEIKGQLNQANLLLAEGEHGIINQLRDLRNTLFNLESFSTEIANLTKRIDLSLEELEDINHAFADIADQAEHDPEAIQEAQDRLDAIYRLQQKHQVFHENGLLEIYKQFQEKIDNFSDMSVGVDVLEKSISSREKKLLKWAAKMSKARKKVAPSFEKDIKALLSKLSMEHAILKVNFEQDLTLNPQGNDLVEFLFSANKGGKLESIRKVASGGELSRLALCTKSIVADVMHLPTLIFDEIDSGVSGDVALKMGQIIKKVATKHQVITITHSPQVASRAKSHFFVYKEDNKKRTLTRVQTLKNEERITEIAKMLSGDPPTKSAILNAEELINEN
ncbi:MAG: DNA repair protein RecN, partial [Bacteroidota bacterium]